MKHGLQLRIIAGMITVLLLITIAVMGVTLSAVRAFFAESARRNAEQRHEGFNHMLDLYKDYAQGHASSLARHPLIVAAVENRNTRNLPDITAPVVREGGLDYLVITDSQGFVIFRAHEPGTAIDPAEGAGVQGHMGRVLQGKAFAGIEQGPDHKLAVRAGAPLFDSSGALIGAVSTGYAIDTERMMEKAKEMLDAEFTLFLGREAVAATLTAAEGEPVPGSVLDDPAMEHAVFREGKTYHGFYDAGQVRYAAFYAPLTDADGRTIGIVCTGLSMADKEQLFTALARRVAVVSPVLLLLPLMAMLLFIRPVTQSLREMREKIQEMAKGRMSIAPCAVRSRDEAGQLAEAVNSMAAKLRDLIGQAACSAGQVAAAARQLTETVGQMAATAERIAEPSARVERESAAQLKSVADINSVIARMTGRIEELTQKTKGVADLSGKAADAVREGGQALDTAAGRISVMETRVAQAARVVTTLGAGVGKIADITAKITDMAGQTNSLAFSAAIEAARAGEQGRGFVSAAEEIARLAEQTQAAAGEIVLLIGDMEEKTGQTAGVMEGGAAEASAETGALGDAASAWERAMYLVREVSEQMRAMSCTLREMTGGCQQIVSSMQQVENSGKETAAQARMISSVTGEQSASLQTIRSSSQALAKMAEELQSALKKQQS